MKWSQKSYKSLSRYKYIHLSLYPDDLRQFSYVLMILRGNGTRFVQSQGQQSNIFGFPVKRLLVKVGLSAFRVIIRAVIILNKFLIEKSLRESQRNQGKILPRANQSKGYISVISNCKIKKIPDCSHSMFLSETI